MKPFLTAKKIARGLNYQYGSHLVINISEFYGGEGDLVKLYVIKDAYYDPGGGYINEELFKSASGVYTVLFMRDLLYTIQGRDIPPDEEDPGWAAQKVKKNVPKGIDYYLEHYVMDIVEVDDEASGITGNYQ